MSDRDPVDAEVAARLRRARERVAGLTQEELAGRVGFSQRKLSDLENGRSHPTPYALRKLAEAIGVRVSYFFDDDEQFISDLGIRVGQFEGRLPPEARDSLIRLARTWADLADAARHDASENHGL